MKIKVGILGGTFDPIHNGHLMIGEQAYRQFGLDYVLVMPSGCPPHKQVTGISNNEHRENMVKLAIADKPHFRYSDFELKRKGTIYTAETLELLCGTKPDILYYFIMGADSLLAIETWRRPERIFELCEIIATGRPEAGLKKEVQYQQIREQISALENKYHGKIHFMDLPLMEVSSTRIRSLIKNRQSVEGLMPAEVTEYIMKHDIYNQ